MLLEAAWHDLLEVTPPMTGGSGLSILFVLPTEGIPSNDNSHNCIPGMLEFGIDVMALKGTVLQSFPCAALLF